MSNENRIPVSKGIYSEQGPKVNLERTATLTLNILYSDDTLENVNWKDWKDSDLPDTSSDYIKDVFIKLLAGQLRNFGDKINFNQFVRTDPSFEQKVNWLLNNNVKYTKRGLKH